MAKKTIKIKKYSDVIEGMVANAAITPGMLCEEMSTGKVRAHATADGNVQPMFALEDELQGKTIDEAYAAADPVQLWLPTNGDIALGILADGENVAIGDPLASNGDGKLKKHVAETESWESADPGSVTVYPEQIVGWAVEAVDLSDSSGGESSGALGYDKRIQVRIK